MGRLRSVSFVFVLAVVTTLFLGVTPAHADGSLEGGGASFPQLEFEQWRSDINKAPYKIKLNYVSSGSTFGRNQYIANLVDFGVSDIPFQLDEVARAAARPYVYVPVSAGGVGFMYNLKDKSGRRVGFPTNRGGTGTDLKLTPHTACRLSTDEQMRWNDPELQADNPDIALPDEPVLQVPRADGAGTSFVLMEYCIATAKDVWDAFVAHVKATPSLSSGLIGDPFLDGKPGSKWPPIGSGATASDGVANVVASDTAGKGAITAVEAGFAEVRGFPNALVRNSAGVFNYPEAANVNAALDHARRNDDGTVTLDYLAVDSTAYYPSSYSYVIAPTNIAATKGATLATFLQYVVTKGQAPADDLGYAPLSRAIVDIALNAIDKIPGAPPRPEIVVFRPGDPGAGGGGSDPGTGGGATDPGTGGGTGGGSDPGTGGGTGGGSDPGTGGGTGGGGSDPGAGGGTGGGSDPGTGGGTNNGATNNGGVTTTRAAGAASATTTRTTGSGASTTTVRNGTNTTTLTRAALGGNQVASPAAQGASGDIALSDRVQPGAPTNHDVLVAAGQGLLVCAAAFALVKLSPRRSGP